MWNVKEMLKINTSLLFHFFINNVADHKDKNIGNGH